MIRLGLKQSDLALIKMSNCTEFAVAFLAAVKLGADPRPGEFPALRRRTEKRRGTSAAALGFHGSRDAPMRCASCAVPDYSRTSFAPATRAPGEISFASLLEQSGTSVKTAETAADEPAFIVYTSGTTGKPKGIVHAHRWIVALGDLNRYRLPPRGE